MNRSKGAGGLLKDKEQTWPTILVGPPDRLETAQEIMGMCGENEKQPAASTPHLIECGKCHKLVESVVAPDGGGICICKECDAASTPQKSGQDIVKEAFDKLTPERTEEILDEVEAKFGPHSTPVEAPLTRVEKNHAARTKLEMKFWTAMHAVGLKDEWDAQERISIDALQNLLDEQPSAPRSQPDQLAGYIAVRVPERITLRGDRTELKTVLVRLIEEFMASDSPRSQPDLRSWNGRELRHLTRACCDGDHVHCGGVAKFANADNTDDCRPCDCACHAESGDSPRSAAPKEEK